MGPAVLIAPRLHLVQVFHTWLQSTCRGPGMHGCSGKCTSERISEVEIKSMLLPFAMLPAPNTEEALLHEALISHASLTQQTDRCTDGWTERWTWHNSLIQMTDRQTNGRTDGQTDGQTDSSTHSRRGDSSRPCILYRMHPPPTTRGIRRASCRSPGRPSCTEARCTSPRAAQACCCLHSCGPSVRSATHSMRLGP